MTKKADINKEIKKAVQQLVLAKNKLKSLGVLRSERLVGEFGEWFAEQLISGKRAISTTQSGWDIICNEKKYQVKTHAKSESNGARWTEWKYTKKEFDFLILLIFSSRLFLNEAYIIPYEIAERRVNRTRKQIVLDWDDYMDFKILEFPENLKLFLANK